MVYYCIYPGCNKKFNSNFKNATYCKVHRDIHKDPCAQKNTINKYINCKKIVNVDYIKNIKVDGKLVPIVYQKKVERLKWSGNCDAGYSQKWECALRGCKKKFEVLLEVGREIYPKYCEEHRNEYKRNRFLQKTGNKNEI